MRGRKKEVLAYPRLWQASKGWPTISKILEIKLNTVEASTHAGLLGKTSHNTTWGFVGKSVPGHLQRHWGCSKSRVTPSCGPFFLWPSCAVWGVHYCSSPLTGKHESAHREASTAGWDGVCEIMPTAYPSLLSTSWCLTQGALVAAGSPGPCEQKQGNWFPGQLLHPPLSGQRGQQLPELSWNCWAFLKAPIKRSAEWKIPMQVPSFSNTGNREPHGTGKTHCPVSDAV